MTSTSVIIQQDHATTPTGGNYQVTSKGGDCLAGVTIFDFVWPIPITVLAMSFPSAKYNNGDDITITIAPDTVTGVLTAPVLVGDVTIALSQTAIDNTKVGFFLTLDDTVNAADLGRVISIDTGALTVTMETPSEYAFAAGTTFVKQNIIAFHDFNFQIGLTNNTFGLAKLTGTYIPANTIVRARYVNNDLHTKKFYAYIELMY